MNTLANCQCLLCTDCFKQNFEVTIREHNVRKFVCPVCQKPDFEDQELADTHFSLLDTMVILFFHEIYH